MPLVNYHVHTPLCGHATGTIDEYIAKAIETGLTEIGFADHAPIPENMREGITMSPSQTEIYIADVLSAKKKYSDKITVRLGFEADFPLFDTFDKMYLVDIRIDYLIGSCHYMGPWPMDHEDYIEEYSKRDIDEIYGNYYSAVEAMVDSNFFNIAGHFDLVKKFGHRETDIGKSRGIIERIAAKMARFGMAAELNTSGLLKPVKEMYPSDDILKIFFDKNVPVTLGADSHSPDTAGYMLVEASEKLRAIGYRKISGFEKRKRFDIEL